jgi:hypothetical protein
MQAQIETERRVRHREKAKITLAHPERLKPYYANAPSLEDVMKERTDDEQMSGEKWEATR